MFYRHFTVAKDFADALGVSESTVSGWRKAEAFPVYAVAFIEALDDAAKARKERDQARRDVATLRAAWWILNAPD